VAPTRARGVLNIAIVPDRRVRALNRRYRRLDYATDVLSFPSGDRGESAHGAARQARAATIPEFLPGNRFLGDIVIAQGTAHRQAAEAGHSRSVELRVLALHGLLHLLGYDHEHDNGEMARIERRLRQKGGLPASLTERAVDSRRSRQADKSPA